MSEGSTSTGPVVVVGHELLAAGGTGHYVDPDGEVELVTRVRFDQPVANPSVLFQLRSESGVIVSTTQSALPPLQRTFAADEQVDVRVRFRARLAGGAYQLVTIITGRDLDE